MKSLIFILLVFSTAALSAHDFWVSEESGMYVLNYGHRSENADGPENIPYEAKDIAEVQCINGSTVKAAQVTSFEGRIAVKEKCEMLFFRTRRTHYTKTPQGTLKKRKNETEFPLKSWISEETVKSILIPAGSVRLSVSTSGLPEIVPQFEKNAAGYYAPDLNKKYTFLVMYKGKPLSGAPVSLNGDVRGTTDAAGKINLKLRSCGDQIIQTSVTVPGDRVTADEITESATLHFRIPCR